jgi:hypothetical protein
MRIRLLPCLILLALSWAAGPFAGAASPTYAQCAPPAPEPSREPNLFTEDQENDLGDVIAEQVLREFRIIDDDGVTGHLREIGARLTRHLPPTRLKLQFLVIELPDANAFVLPGGRVFVSRKLIGFAGAEDELAGVIAHELGHLLARQQTLYMSRAFRSVLGVTTVGDRADIAEKYHRLLDNAARNPRAVRQSDSHQSSEQVAADRLGLFVLAAAGYDPLAYARLYDRMVETKGNTGGFFSDLFGTTPPEARRLRELIKTIGALPPGCSDQRVPGGQETYRKWQVAVAAYTGRARKEALRGVVSRTALTPALRSQVQHLRFSADGRLLLAQDDAGISVLTRSPFAHVFRIDASEAAEASFTPDSQRIAFLTSDLRVELWDVAQRARQASHDLVLRKPCLQAELAPTGGSLACLDQDFSLTLFDVASGAVIYQKKQFYEPDVLTMLQQLMSVLGVEEEDRDLRLVHMGFSTDGRFFAAGHHRNAVPMLGVGSDDFALVYDLTSRAPIDLKSGAKRLIGGGFAFTGPNRLIGINSDDLKKSGVVLLPAGDVVQELAMFRGRLSAATQGAFLFVRPFQKYSVAVMDLAKGQVVKGSENPAIDFHGEVFAIERGSGEIGLYGAASNQLHSSANLPTVDLGRLRAAAVSADFRYLAMSERSRGAVWELTQGTRTALLRGFRGAGFTESGDLVADFPAFREERRQVTRLDRAQKAAVPIAELKPIAEIRNEERARQHGQFLLTLTLTGRGPAGPQGIAVLMRDALTGATLWTRTFSRESPRIWVDGHHETVVLAWPASGATAREESRRTPELRRQFEALAETEGDYLVQVLDARSGATQASLFVETGKGSFTLTGALAGGNWLIVEDSETRARVYSTARGEPRGRVFGTVAAASMSAGLMAVENDAGTLVLYDFATLRPRETLVFSRPVALARFSPDGRRLFVATADQTAFVLTIGGQ